jgi:glucose-1-phosphate cytidylyltransferase
MQVIILAGGLGIRMGDETVTTPKPMLRIGNRPILWHVMKHFYEEGFTSFLILGGYKIEVIRDFFRNYHEEFDPITFYGHWAHQDVTYYEDKLEQWLVGILDTDLTTPTGGRLLKARNYIMGPTILTYGDGLADIDIQNLVAYAEASGKLVTITAVHQPGRFGTLTMDQDRLIDFREKPLEDNWINGGFWYIKPEALEYFKEDEMLEQGGIQRLLKEDQVAVYKHEGFWRGIDTRRDLEAMNTLWRNGEAPWKNWS